MGQSKINTNSVLAFFASTLILLVAMIAFAPSTTHAQAGACSTLSDAKGRADFTTPSSVGAGDYTVWSRVKASSGTTAAYQLSIDGDGGSACDQTVTTTVSGTDWKWVKQSATIDWTGGVMRFQMAGTIDGVGLDCVVLRTDTEDLSASGKEGCDENYGGGGTPTPTPTPTPGECGDADFDVNGNGSVTSGDAFQVYSNINKTDEDSLCKFDVNRNGAITSGDAFQVYSNIEQ